MSLVRVERQDDGIAVVTLHDPDRRNAMTVAMGDAIEATFQGLANDDDLRVVVLTGAPPAFSGGGDLDMLDELGRRSREDDYDATEHMRTFYRRFLSVRDVPVPVIAAINGHAIGAGLCIALACDLLLVAEDAKVGLNFSRLGLHPGMAGSWLLPRHLGWQRAAQWLYTGDIVSGTVAAAQGMALQALATDQVLPAAMDMAGRIATASPLVVRQLKGSLEHARTTSLLDHLDHEAAEQAVSYASEDLAEGLAAIRARREPRFRGR